MAALLYADDMALLAPSIKGLNRLLHMCSSYCIDWDICLNEKKSKAMYFGKRCKNLYTLHLNEKPIDWIETWPYLGVQLVSGKRFGCSAAERIRKFYRCSNAIFRINGRSNDLIMLRLVESHCIPILTYAMELSHLSDARENSKMRAAYNSLFRKIFGYRTFESVTELQLNLARPTWEMLMENMRSAFYARLALCKADSPIHIFSLLES